MESLNNSPTSASTLNVKTFAGGGLDSVFLSKESTPASIPRANPAPLSVKQFRSYQLRLPVTGISLLSGLTLVLLSPPSIPLGSPLYHGMMTLGYVLLGLGIAIRVWSIAYINSRKSTSIVTTGPYSLCRNPLYVGTLAIVVGYLLMVQSLTMAIFALPVVFLYIWGVVPVEEKVLRSRHPVDYDAYCETVPRWIPRFKKSAFARARLVWSKAVRREVECAFWWVGIALLVHFVCSFRTAAWWIHPLMWP